MCLHRRSKPVALGHVNALGRNISVAVGKESTLGNRGRGHIVERRGVLKILGKGPYQCVKNFLRVIGKLAKVREILHIDDYRVHLLQDIGVESLDRPLQLGVYVVVQNLPGYHIEKRTGSDCENQQGNKHSQKQPAGLLFCGHLVKTILLRHTVLQTMFRGIKT